MLKNENKYDIMISIKNSGFGILRVTAIPYGIKPYLRSLMDVDKLILQRIRGTKSPAAVETAGDLWYNK